MRKIKTFWEKGLHPITGFEQGENWNYNDELKKQNERQKQKRRDMRKQVELSTGIKTVQNKKKNGVVSIHVQDTVFDDTLKDDLFGYLTNIFKPL